MVLKYFVCNIIKEFQSVDPFTILVLKLSLGKSGSRTRELLMLFREVSTNTSFTNSV